MGNSQFPLRLQKEHIHPEDLREEGEPLWAKIVIL